MACMVWWAQELEIQVQVPALLSSGCVTDELAERGQIRLWEIVPCYGSWRSHGRLSLLRWCFMVAGAVHRYRSNLAPSPTSARSITQTQVLASCSLLVCTRNRIFF